MPIYVANYKYTNNYNYPNASFILYKKDNNKLLCIKYRKPLVSSLSYREIGSIIARDMASIFSYNNFISLSFYECFNHLRECKCNNREVWKFVFEEYLKDYLTN